MTMIANIPITVPATLVATNWLQFRDGAPESMVVQAKFTYGSGGATLSAWLQTSFDDGLTPVDICNFSFTTASLRALMNLSSLLVVSSPLIPTDGALAANTASGTLIGHLLRLKYSTTGTYAGGSALRVDVSPNRGRITSLI